jgi:uncharacterized Zn finger protein (UPF0148 family)
MNCPNCGTDDPEPASSDNGTTTCPQCGHRFPIDEAADDSAAARGAWGLTDRPVEAEYASSSTRRRG